MLFFQLSMAIILLSNRGEKIERMKDENEQSVHARLEGSIYRQTNYPYKDSPPKILRGERNEKENKF